MAESATLTSADSPHKVPQACKPPARVRFQRAKPNLSAVAGRRPGAASITASTVGLSATAVTSPQVTLPVPVPISRISQSPATPSSVTNEALAAPPSVEPLTPPPVTRVPLNLLPNSNEVNERISSGDRIPDAQQSSESSSSSEVQLSSSSTTTDSVVEVAISSNEQNPSAAEADHVFAKPSTSTRVSKKQKEPKVSSRDADKEVVTQKRRKKIICEKPEKNKMTMFDFIHWNPASNPMIYAEEEKRVQLADMQTNADEPSDLTQRLTEEAIDNPEAAPSTSEGVVNGSENVDEEQQTDVAATSGAEPQDAVEDDAMPVPQVKIGPDGNIILDEQSLVIETTASKSSLSNSPAVYEHSSNTSYSCYRKQKPSKNWREKETTKFYMALSSVGTDFSLMEQFFPKRSRHELKLKFKREERLNRPLVEKAINDRQQFDLSLIGDGDEDEEDELRSSIDKAKSNCRRRYVKTGKKRGRKPREINEESNETVTVDGVVAKVMRKRKYKRRQTLQMESDSDGDKEDEAYVEDKDEPPKRKKKLSQKKGKTKAGKKRGTAKAGDDATSETHCSPGSADEPENRTDPLVSDEQDVEEINNNAEEEKEEESDDESDEIVDTLLRRTRSGRQPKKNSIFTIKVTTPKPSRSRRTGRPRKCKDIDKSSLRSTQTEPSSTSPNILSPNQLILLADKPVGCGGSQVIHLLMYSQSATPGAPGAVQPVIGGGSPPECTLPGLTQHDRAFDSAETFASGDRVELQTAISELTGAIGNDNVVLYDAAVSF